MIDYMVRNGQRVAVTCNECGCRLRGIPLPEEIWGVGGISYAHFRGSLSTDARGCKCSNISMYEIRTSNHFSQHYTY